MTKPVQIWLSMALIVASFVPQWFDPLLKVPVTGPVEKMFLLATCLVFGSALAALVLRASAAARLVLAALIGLSFAATVSSGDRVDLSTVLIVAARLAAAAFLFTPRVSAWLAAERAKARTLRLAPRRRPALVAYATRKRVTGLIG
jgi:putative effector of murein hydrolase LrgA (UPF0299 family)